MLSIFLYDPPLQTAPLREYPELQEHWKEPIVFLHSALAGQELLSLEHSSTSKSTINDIALMNHRCTYQHNRHRFSQIPHDKHNCNLYLC